MGTSYSSSNPEIIADSFPLIWYSILNTKQAIYVSFESKYLKIKSNDQLEILERNLI